MTWWRRSQTRKCWAVFVLACVVWVSCLPALARAEDDPPLAPAELRAVLEAVEELKAAREEITQLKVLVAKDADTINSLQKQVAALERLSDTQEKMLNSMLKVQTAYDQATETYRKMAAAADLRAEKAEARAEKAERWMWLGPVLGMLLGAAMVGLAVVIH